MSTSTTIEWTDSTWNPVTGCTKISPGCKYCYAERMAYRLQAMGQPNYKNGFKVTVQPHMLELPLRWKKPMNIFVNSMSDLFHKNIPEEYILRVFEIMNIAHWHRFQVLTKRSERLVEMNSQLQWSENIWMGVTVENADYLHRIDHLRKTGAVVKFLSLEPLLGLINQINLTNIDWAIVGGESGPFARSMTETWVEILLKQCKEQSVPFFFKQWGGKNKKRAGRTLKGSTWDEMPSIIQVS